MIVKNILLILLILSNKYHVKIAEIMSKFPILSFGLFFDAAWAKQ